MRIVSKQFAAGNIDLLDHGMLVETGVTDGREIIQIGIPHTGQGQLLLRFAQFAVLDLQLELMHL